MLQGTDLANQSATFYWIDGDSGSNTVNYAVTYTATFDNQSSLTVTAYFSPVRPNPVTFTGTSTMANPPISVTTGGGNSVLNFGTENAFLAQLRLQGSAVLSTGVDVQYNPGTGYYVVSTINAADGSPVVAGETVARDRSIIPKTPTTYIDINSIGTGLSANDTGGAIVGYRIDWYGGAGSGVCSAFNNIMAVSGCNPSNQACPGDTTVQ